MKELVINGITYYTDDPLFNYQVVSAVGIMLAQRVISETFDYAAFNKKKVVYVKVVTSSLWGETYKITKSH
jgi:hypothetical protein